MILFTLTFLATFFFLFSIFLLFIYNIKRKESKKHFNDAAMFLKMTKEYKEENEELVNKINALSEENEALEEYLKIIENAKNNNVYEIMKYDIKKCILPQSSKLPEIKILCKIYKATPNTIVKTIAHLMEQGYIKAIKGKGLFIS